MTNNRPDQFWIRASEEYVQAINGFAPIFSVCGKHKEGKVSEKEVVRTVKKYLRRVGNDAADSIDGLVAHFAKIDPVVPHGDKIKIRYYRGITDAEFNDFFGK